MIEALFAANVLMLGLLYLLLNEKAGRIIAIFYAVYMGAFIILKPALSYYFDLFYPFSTNAPEAVGRYLVGTLIFLAVQLAGIRYFSDRPPAPYAARWFDFDQATPRGLTIAFIVLMGISFVGCTLKFGTPAYLVSYVDTFTATMALAQGSYYLNFVAEMLVYGMLMAIAASYWRYSAGRSFLAAILIIALTFFWTKLSYRTTILVAILAWASCAISHRQQRRWGLVRLGLLGYFLLVILYVANFIRLGAVDRLGDRNMFLSAVTGAASDLVPVDDAIMLYQNFSSQNLTHFVYLLGAITPLGLVPPSLIPFKPRVDKDASLTDMYFPHGADQSFFHEAATLTFTVPASGYADAYYFGVLVASVLYVALFVWYLRIYRYGSKSSRYMAAYWLMFLVAGFRLSIESLMLAFYAGLLFVAVTRLIALAASSPFPGSMPQAAHQPANGAAGGAG